MKTIRIYSLLLLLVCGVPWSLAQRAEYWIDADPGFGHGIGITVTGEVASAVIPTTALVPGMHTLGVRAAVGHKWGQTYTHRFVVLPNNGVTTLSGAEYWIDTDPGQGQATAVSLAAEATQLTIPVNTEGLAPGLHTFGARIRQGNAWGQTYTHRFVILPNNGVTTLSGAEYWIDTDPGQGQATAVSLAAEATQLTIPVNTEGLAPGLHTFGARIRQGDAWGQTYTHRFVILPNNGVTTLSGAEYWIDIDPGQGQATAVSLAAEATQLTIPVSMEGLTTGLHTFGARIRQGDAWGQTYTHRFVVLPNNGVTTLSGAEYWIDTDPGQGQATAVSLAAEATQLTIPVSTEGLTTGLHTFGARIRQGNAWGQTYTHRFVILPNNGVTTLSGAEYWIDTDPGQGQATAVSLAAEATQLTIPVNTEDLSLGTHIFGARLRQGNTWGQTYTHRFFVMPDRSTPMTIETVEACWDYDIEHVIAIPFTQDGDSAVINNQVFDIDALSLGTHVLCLCAKADGKWGILAVYEVTKSEATGLDGVAEQVVTYKILRNDQVLIIRDGDTYTLQGLKIKD